ncbi:MAG: hypothetical protein GXO83_10385 [Chlorobi bacterium]|nr:hypothetical protein [Chlorobiota bacterium]
MKTTAMYRAVSQRTAIFLLTLLLFASVSFAQLSGSYTIDPAGGDFTSKNCKSFTEAVDSLMSQGVNGPVVFNVADGTYTERIEIFQINGSSAVNTITFQSQSLDSTKVTLTYMNPDNTSNWVLRLNDADYVTIRKMRLQATGSSYARVININNTANNNIIENCQLWGYSTTSNSNYLAIIASFYDQAENNIIRNNYFLNGSYGIYMSGVSNTTLSAGTQIVNNTFIDQSEYGVWLRFHDAPVVNSNEFELTKDPAYGIYMRECDNVLEIRQNKINLTLGSYGIFLEYCDGTLGQEGKIVNNFISITGTNTARGIYLSNCTFQNIFHNSVNVTSTATGNNGSAFYITGGANNDVRNNIFSNTGGSYAYNIKTAGAIKNSDFNDYYASGNYLAYWNGDIGDLSELQAANGFDASSVSVDPHFFSASDLHTTTFRLDGTGDNSLGISADIDGEPRLSPPDIGADEFTGTGTPLSGTYTIGGTSPDFTTFTSAVDSLNAVGIASSVVFNVRDGVYNEQIRINPVAGADASNTVTFQSQSGDSTTVTLSYTSGTNNNWVVRLQRADFITFKSMTFAALDNTNALVFSFQGNSNNDSLLNCVFNSDVSGTTGNSVIHSYDDYINDIVISNNVINGGKYGIYLNSNNQNNPAGIKIAGNVISGQKSSSNYGIYLRYLDAPEVTGNTVINTGSSGYYAIYLRDCINSFKVLKNKISSNNTTGGIRLYSSAGNTTNIGIVANNLIDIGGTSTAYGISTYSSSYTNIYYNSIKITSSDKSNGIAFYNSGSSGNLVLKNNIFSNFGGGYAYYSSSITAISQSDYNDLFTNGNFIAYWNSTKLAELSDFQTASGKDANSVSVNPVFVSSSDLHASSFFLDGAGTVLSAVVEDYDGESRDGVNPDIGADEYTSPYTPLSGGIYTIGGSSPDYATFTDAADDLNSRGISGPVTFMVRNGSYNEQINLYSISGASNTNRIIFQSESGDSSSVEISFSSTVDNNYVIQLTGADYITLREITVSALDNTYSKAIRFFGNANHDSIANCVINADLTGVTSNGAIDSWEANIGDIVIINNMITGGKYGIFLNSDNNSVYAINTVVSNNIISSQNGTNPVSIYLRYHDTPIVSSNAIDNNASASSFYGIQLQNCNNDLKVRYNKISSDNSYGGILIHSCIGTASKNGLISNNFVDIGGNTYARGIYTYNSDYQNIFFNSVRITSSDISSGRAFYNGNGSNINIQNNIFSNLNGGYAFYTNSATAIVNSDYNDIFTTGNYLAYWNGNITDLQAFRTASGKDANSLSVNPGFVSANDLHSTSSFLDGSGLYLSTVTDDIDGEIRDLSTPDIGADEFTPTEFPLSGIYTIGGSTPDYATFSDAVNDLNVRGISGNVIFNVRSGTYNEQFKLLEASGISPADTIVFQSESGDSTSVIITYNAQNSGENYVIYFSGADYVTMKNVTISATGSSYATDILITGNVKNLNLCNNILISSNSASNADIINAPDGNITENLFIHDNFFSEGKRAVYLNGNYSTPSSGTRIIQNTINSASVNGIYLEDQDAPVIIGNAITNQGNAFNGIVLNNCDNALRVIGNKVFNTGYYNGITIQNCNGTLAFTGLIANNFVSIGGTSNSYGISLEYSDYQNVFYNNVLITSTGSTRTFTLNQGSNINIKNNIFANTGGSYAYYIGTISAVISSDHNNLYTTGTNLARWNGNITSLAALQSASGMDINSVSVDPLFLSETDLHTIQPLFHQAAEPVPEVVFDIDSIPRDPAKPDIGAQEFYCETPAFDVFVSPTCLGDSTTFIDNSTNIAPGSTYSWDFDNDFNPEITSSDPHDTVYNTFSAAGSYTVNFIVNQIAGCNDFTTLTAIVHASPTLDISTLGAYCDSLNGEASVTVLSGTGPFTYFWSNGSTDTAVTGLATGTYTVAVSDSFNCSTTETVEIGDAIQVTVTEVQGSTCGASDGIATASVTGGVEPYFYVWSDGDTTATNNSLPPGIHYVNVIDANGCYSQGSVNIGNNGSGPQISLVGITHNQCYADQTGSIDISISGGVQPYGILWSDGSHTEDIDSLKAGIYNIEVTDNTGCITSESFTVTQPPALSISDVISDATCASSDGKAVVVASGGTSPYFYAWSTGGTDQIEENLQAGIYSVIITDAKGCQTVHPVIVNNIGGPVVTVNSVTGLTCTQTAGGAIDISISGGTPLYSYSWSPGGQTTQDISNLSLGTYEVTVTDDAGCVGVASASVIKTPPPANPICLVTVDSISGMNLVVWEKSVTTDVDFYNIYRESAQKGSYQLVGRRPVDSLSEFIDSVANPAVRSWKYKLSVVDKCGNESAFSEPHKTIHLTQNLGLNNTINLIWDHYEGFSFSSYNVYRYSSVSGWELLGTLASTLTSFTDLTLPPSGTFYYVVEVLLPQPCISSAVKTSYNSARSNKTTTQSANTGIGSQLTGNIEYLNLYPNPNHGVFNLSFSTRNNDHIIIRILDVSGRQIWVNRLNHFQGKSVLQIDLSEYGSGVYQLQFITGKAMLNKPVIIR